MASQGDARPRSWPGVCFFHPLDTGAYALKTPPCLCTGSPSSEGFSWPAWHDGAAHAVFTPACSHRRRSALAASPLPAGVRGRGPGPSPAAHSRLALSRSATTPPEYCPGYPWPTPPTTTLPSPPASSCSHTKIPATPARRDLCASARPAAAPPFLGGSAALHLDATVQAVRRGTLRGSPAQRRPTPPSPAPPGRPGRPGCDAATQAGPVGPARHARPL